MVTISIVNRFQRFKRELFPSKIYQNFGNLKANGKSDNQFSNSNTIDKIFNEFKTLPFSVKIISKAVSKLYPKT